MRLASLAAILLAAIPTLADARSDSSFVGGSLDGRQTEIVLLSTGGSFGSDRAHVFVDDGRFGTVDAGVVVARGGGDLELIFASEALYVLNRAPLPGECNGCASRLAVQRLHFHDHRLESDGIVNVATPKTRIAATYARDVLAEADRAFDARRSVR